MLTMLEEYTTEKYHSVVRFCRQNDSMQSVFLRKYFFVYGRNRLPRKAVHNLVEPRFAHDEEF
jgi:hypothetical protein